MNMIGYHITNKENLYSIAINGLGPSIGFNSNKIGDKREQLFLLMKNILIIGTKYFMIILKKKE